MELKRIKEIVSSLFHVPPDAVTDTASFTEDLGADSLELFRLRIEIEEAFEVEIPDSEALKIDTAADAAAMLRSLVR